MLHQVETHIVTGEVTSLEHEIRNHTVEYGVLVPVTMLVRAKSTKVFGGFGDHVIVEDEVDAALLLL